ncbi:MAG: GMC family oxidoreductase N-terminal domain-containing protein [Aureliella sp.]
MLDEYDYVVVGGGAAGCIVAQQIAERSESRVALIESGPPRTDARGLAPAWYPRLFGSKFDWNFQTAPIPGLAGRKLAWPRGKTLGGSAAINALIYLQPPDEDFHRWGLDCPPQATNSHADHYDATKNGVTECDGARCAITGLSLRPVEHIHPWCEQFLSAAESAGLQRSDQMQQLAPAQNGAAGTCGPYWLTQNMRGHRQHVGQQVDSHASGNRPPTNLHVLHGNTVDRLEISKGRVCGVELKAGEAQRTIRARREVVLCAGTIGSPSILLSSGIGPAASLQAAGVTSNIESPHVGQHLQDHLVYPVIYESDAAEGLPERFDRMQRESFRQGRPSGLASNIAEAGGVFHLGQGNDSVAFQIHATPTHYLKYPRLATVNNHMSLGITQLRPRSEGTLSLAPRAIGIASNDVVIKPNYLSDAADIDDFAAAIAWVRENLSPKLATTGWSEVLPGRRGDAIKTLRRSIAAYSMSIYHPTGTCRMGNAIDDSVVGSDFSVHGIRGLRIADASVFPSIPASNTMAPTFWLAHLCAQSILNL